MTAPIETPSGIASPPPPPALEPLDPLARSTRRLDLVSSILTAGVLAVIEMGGGIAKKGFGATDFQVALLTAGQSAGLMLSFFIAHLAATRPKMPLVVWPEMASRLLLVGILFLASPGLAGVFVVIHALAQMFNAIPTPARITIYRLNYPTSRRGGIVGRIRQIQLLLTALAAVGISLLLDWGHGKKWLLDLLGEAPFSANIMISRVVPAMAVGGILGTLVFRRIRVREEPPSAGAGTIGDTFRQFLRIYREDRDFRRYENFFFLFGFADIMSIPLTQIHVVDVLGADYSDIAIINVVLVQGLMALTMAFWGRRLDRNTPNGLRGILNIIFSVDFLVLAIAPSIGWVYLGRIFRGIAMGGGTLVWMLGSLYYARSKELAPIYLGIHTVLTGVRWLLAPFIGVILKQFCGHSARPIFFLSFLVVLGSALLMLRQSRKEEYRKPVEDPMPAPRTTGA